MAARPAQDRRQKTDRRNHAARRRHAERRRLCVELCHSDLRVATIVDSDSDGPPHLSTRTVPWRRDATDLFSARGRAELTAALSRVVAEDRLAGCAVSFAINATLCVNRDASGALAEVEQQVAALRERSQLYLALGPGPKTAAVARKAIDARHEHALVTVTNQQTLDLLVDAADAAGLVVDVVESALVALSRLQGRLEPGNEEAVLFAQIDEERFELGVSQAGRLLMEYRPARDATTADLGSILDDHHDRLTRFCNRQAGSKAVSLRRMWLVGDTPHIQSANTTTKHRLDASPPPLEGVEQLWAFDGPTPAPMMAAALGLALRGRVEEAGVSPNLMDEVHARAKAPLRPVLVRSAAPIAASLLLAAGLWAVNIEEGIRLSALRSQVDAIRPELLRGKRITSQIADAATESTHLGRLAELATHRPLEPLVRYLGAHFSPEVWVRGFRLTDQNVLSLTGTSLTETGVYDTVRRLEEAPDLTEVALRGSGSEQTPFGPATTFEIDMQLTTADQPEPTDG
ncbi:hypothetical protein [Botrimarina sp.]|uniref:hypothetical protein n=1 Tax=Botrimarina sp. TaxID=2795802 RepID=UPI0032F07F7B